jgi:hypothetical protein
MEGRIKLFYFFAILSILIFGFRSSYNVRRGVNIKTTKNKTICQDTSAQHTL